MGDWSTSKHGNEAAIGTYIYRLHFRLRKQFSSSGLSPIRGVFLHTRKDRDICSQHALYFSEADCVLCGFSDHTFRGVISCLTCLWAHVDCQDSSYLQNSSFFGATSLHSLLKGKGKASSCLEWGELSRKWPKMKQTHSASLFNWE